MSLLVALAVLLPGLTEMYYGYREAMRQVGRTQTAQAQEVAAALQGSLGLIERQVGGITMLPWEVPGWLELEQRREEYLRLLRIAPSVTQVRWVDAAGAERLAVSRREVDRVASAGMARPQNEKTVDSPSPGCFRCAYARVSYENDYDPTLSITIADAEHDGGRTEARVGLRALAAEIAPALALQGSMAMVVDDAGTVLLHQTPSLVLERRRIADKLRAALAGSDGGGGHAGLGLDGQPVIASWVPLRELHWWVLVEQPRAAALKPVFATLLRTGAFLAGGLILALLAANALAARMTRPVLALHDGAAALGSGDLSTRIDIRTDDELQEVAEQFNRMARNLQDSHTGLAERIAEKTRDLEIANRHKSEFLAHMSHELRTPLNSIIGPPELILKRGSLGEDEKQLLRHISAAGKHLRALIDDLLDLEKIEAGRMELHREELSVEALIASAVAMVQSRAEQAGISIQVSVADDAAIWNADPRRLKQVLVNLLSNAVKFTPPSGKIEVTAAVAGDELRMAVSDTGIGIAAEDLPYVGREFRQFGAEGGAKHEGTGLGLALVRRFVELHGGTVTIASELLKGTTVRFMIPRQ